MFRGGSVRYVGSAVSKIQKKINLHRGPVEINFISAQSNTFVAADSDLQYQSLF